MGMSTARLYAWIAALYAVGTLVGSVAATFGTTWWARCLIVALPLLVFLVLLDDRQRRHH
jgi:hypothetical protein